MRQFAICLEFLHSRLYQTGITAIFPLTDIWDECLPAPLTSLLGAISLVNLSHLSSVETLPATFAAEPIAVGTRYKQFSASFAWNRFSWFSARLFLGSIPEIVYSIFLEDRFFVLREIRLSPAMRRTERLTTSSFYECLSAYRASLEYFEHHFHERDVLVVGLGFSGRRGLRVKATEMRRQGTWVGLPPMPSTFVSSTGEM